MNDAKLYNVIRAPRVSEKTARLQEINQYVFEVATTATKADVKLAVEALFNVKVTSVNTLNRAGKTKRFRGIPGKQNSTKKAIVTLAEGQSIDVMTASA